MNEKVEYFWDRFLKHEWLLKRLYYVGFGLAGGYSFAHHGNIVVAFIHALLSWLSIVLFILFPDTVHTAWVFTPE